ncbi:MAG: hypothetical protein KH452_03280 [Clostridiales bacterium]|nr:hypothetical protein [Clostridiales bacterium]
MTNKVDRLKSKGLFIVILSLCFGGVYIRGAFVPEQLVAFNAIAFVECSFLLIVGFYEKGIKLNYMDIKFTLIFISLTALFLLTELFAEKSLVSIIKCYGGLLVPLILVHVRIKELENFQVFFVKFMKFFNNFIGVLLILAIAGYLFENKIAIFTATILKSSQLMSIVSSRRFVSFLGHPLYNTEFFVAYFGLNAVYQKYLDKKKSFWYVLISLAGVLLTGSKTGIVLILMGTLMLNISNLKWLLTYLVAVVGLYFGGFFDLIISRLLNETLTTGRSEKWIELINMVDIDINWFYGNGHGSVFELNDIVRRASAAFEYPFKLFPYEFGIIFTIILYMVLFVFPAYYFLKRKQYTILVIFGMLVLDVNSYNGLGLYQDHMYTYCFFLCLILNVSRYAHLKKII